MKRILSILLCVTLLFVLVGCTSAHKHTFVDGVCSCGHEQETFVVVFDTTGGNEISNLNVLEGEKVSKPTDPTKDGYKFVGWFTELTGGVEYDFSTPVYANDTIYAWGDGNRDMIIYKITAIKFNGSGGGNSNDRELTWDEYQALPDAEKYNDTNY